MDAAIGGMIGLFGGMIFGAFGWWYGRHKAKQNRGLDELYRHIWRTARSTSWYFTLAALYLLFSLHLFGIEMSIGMVLGILILVHIGSWGIVGGIVSVNMSVEDPLQVSRVFIGASIMVISTLFFAILAIAFKNILIILLGIIPNIIGLIIILSRKKEE